MTKRLKLAGTLFLGLALLSPHPGWAHQKSDAGCLAPPSKLKDNLDSEYLLAIAMVYQEKSASPVEDRVLQDGMMREMRKLGGRPEMSAQTIFVLDGALYIVFKCPQRNRCIRLLRHGMARKDDLAPLHRLEYSQLGTKADPIVAEEIRYVDFNRIFERCLIPKIPVEYLDRDRFAEWMPRIFDLMEDAGLKEFAKAGKAFFKEFPELYAMDNQVWIAVDEVSEDLAGAIIFSQAFNPRSLWNIPDVDRFRPLTYIRIVGVKEGYRRHKVGARLVREVEKTSGGLFPYFATTPLDDDAKAFFRSLGYAPLLPSSGHWIKNLAASGPKALESQVAGPAEYSP